MKRLLLPLLLAGCAGFPGTPRPESVTLSRDTLRLVLSDGQVCRADWSAAPVGRMQECGPGYGYAVKVDPNRNILRQITEELDLALGGGLVSPMAEVVITDPAGVDHVFAAPEPIRDVNKD